MGIPRQVMEAEAQADALLEKQAAAEKQGAKFVFDPNGQLPEPGQQGEQPEQPEQPAAPTHPTAQPEVKPLTPMEEQPPAAEGDQGGTPEPGKGGGLLDALNNPDPTTQSPEELAQQVQRLRSMMGRLQADHAKVKEVLDENAKLKEQLEAERAETSKLREQVETLTAGGGSIPSLKAPQDRIEFLRTKFGKDFSDEDLNAFNDVITAIVREETSGDRQALSDMKKRDQKARLTAFMSRLEQEFPLFPQIDGSNDKRWVEFLGRAVSPLTPDITNGIVAKKALSELNYPGFVNVVKAFATEYQIDLSQSGEIPAEVAAQARPASRPGNHGKQNPKAVLVPRSEIEAFRRAYLTGKVSRDYGISNEEAEKRIVFYENAEAEGRVDEGR